MGASGIHVGTMGYGKMEGGADDRKIEIGRASCRERV